MTTKICKTCNLEKDINQFIYYGWNRSNCRECRSAISCDKQRRTYLRECSICQKELVSVHFNSRNAICKECEKLNLRRCKHCDTCKDLNEFYLPKNGKVNYTYCKKCNIIRAKESYKKSGGWKETRREYNKKTIKKRLVYAAKLRAKEYELPFNIDESDINIPEFCPVLGIEIKTAIGKMNDNSPTLDKLIPSMGYVKGNINIISWRANQIKNNGTADEHEKIAKWMREKGAN